MKNDKKKRIAIISSIAALMFIAPLVVLAVFYSSRARNNQFAPAEADLQIAENDENAQKNQTIDSFRWQDQGKHEVEKKVEFQENSNPNGEYLRVRFVPTWYDKNGNVCAGIDGVTDVSHIKISDDGTCLLFCKGNTDADVVVKLVLTDQWSNNWEHKGNGVFESKVLIKSGNGKKELLKKVEIPNEVYMAAKTAELELHVDVLADAIQTLDGQDTAPRWNDTP